MFSDPQSLIANATTISLPAISRGDDSSVYSGADATLGYNVKFTIGHQYKTRSRITSRVDCSAVVTDPLVPAQSTNMSFSVYIVVDLPANGTQNLTNTGYYVKALAAWLAASTNTARMLAGET